MTGLPPEAQIAAGKLEDALELWEQRDPAHHHPRVREAGDVASRQCDALVEVFDRKRRELAAEIGAYDDAVRRRA